VRVVVHVVDHDQKSATETARDFVKAMFDPLSHYLPA
jgi:hypothetical protein